ncbi:MAG TPA: hypothetical protein VIS06_04665 [Mycobacteriales bacterium]|jgi:hypothetical protein
MVAAVSLGVVSTGTGTVLAGEAELVASVVALDVAAEMPDVVVPHAVRPLIAASTAAVMMAR